MSGAERSRKARDKKRGGPPRELVPCGEWAAHQRHVRRGEPIDQACKDAAIRHRAEQYQKRQKRKAAK